MPEIRVKRIYEPASPEDGHRLLVDRLWPRGMSKERAHIDAWIRDVGPSTALRKWFGHDPTRWDEFVRRYQAELAANPESIQALVDATGSGPATLLYAARDEQHNEALVLQRLLQDRLARAASDKAAELRDEHDR